MQQHGIKYFACRVADSQSTPPPPPPNMVGQEVKILILQNLVMLPSKLNVITNATTWKQIFCLQTHPLYPGGQKVEIQHFQNMVMLHIKLKGITNAATWWQLFCPQTPNSPSQPWGWGQHVKIQLFHNIVMLHIN